MVVIFDDQDVTLCAHPGIDDRQVHAAAREVVIAAADPEASLGRPLGGNVVCQIDDPGVRKSIQNDAVHHGGKRSLVTKVGRDGDDA